MTDKQQADLLSVTNEPDAAAVFGAPTTSGESVHTGPHNTTPVTKPTRSDYLVRFLALSLIAMTLIIAIFK